MELFEVEFLAERFLEDLIEWEKNARKTLNISESMNTDGSHGQYVLIELNVLLFE